MNKLKLTTKQNKTLLSFIEIFFFSKSSTFAFAKNTSLLCGSISLQFFVRIRALIAETSLDPWILKDFMGFTVPKKRTLSNEGNVLSPCYQLRC